VCVVCVVFECCVLVLVFVNPKTKKITQKPV